MWALSFSFPPWLQKTHHPDRKVDCDHLRHSIVHVLQQRITDVRRIRSVRRIHPGRLSHEQRTALSSHLYSRSFRFDYTRSWLAFDHGNYCGPHDYTRSPDVPIGLYICIYARVGSDTPWRMACTIIILY